MKVYLPQEASLSVDSQPFLIAAGYRYRIDGRLVLLEYRSDEERELAVEVVQAAIRRKVFRLPNGSVHEDSRFAYLDDGGWVIAWGKTPGEAEQCINRELAAAISRRLTGPTEPE